jgi:hypothetical protein
MAAMAMPPPPKQKPKSQPQQMAQAEQQAHAQAEQQPESESAPGYEIQYGQVQESPAYAGAAAAADGSDTGGGGSRYAGGGGGYVSGEGASLSALMDELLGSDAGRPLAEAGPACARVVEAVAAPEAGQSFLAGVFWWLFTRSEAYRDAKKRLRASRRARPVVVSHAEGTRFDLLLLDPRRQKRMAALPLQIAQTSRGFRLSDLQRLARLRLRPSRFVVPQA